jgi:hypothetical protein
MVQIDDKLISLDVFEKRFVCDLGKCHGECCVEGESGAPLDDDEVEIIERLYPLMRPYMSEKAVAEVEKNGAWIIDDDGDKVTPIIEGRECVYTSFEEDGTVMCLIEKLYNEGKTDFKKPISCHLYPIRVTKYPAYEALNYHSWPICAPARELGGILGVPLFRFLKEPIIRKNGKLFYDEMEDVAKTLIEKKIIK